MLPPIYLGLGMPNMVVNCLAGKIFFLQCSWGFEEAECEMMRQAYEAFLIEVGLSGDVFQRNFAKLGILSTPGTWFSNLWELASHLGVSISTDPKYHLKPARIGDELIIERFLSMDMEESDLEPLNRVRKHKKVLFLSDLVHCDGTTIRANMMDNSEGVSPLWFPR